MKSWLLNPLRSILVLALLLCVGVPAAMASKYNADELTQRIKTGAYLQKTDNVMIIIDGLGHNRRAKMKLAKEIMVGIGDTIPNVPHTRLLRMFGPDADDFESDYSTIFGMYNSQGANFHNYTPIIATKTYETSVFDPLGLSFINAATDLGKLGGTNAVIIISDGQSVERSSLAESAFLKKKFGGSICYYPLMIGDDSLALSRMDKLTRIGGCGFMSAADKLTNPEAMTNFVEKVMFVKRRIPKKPEPPVVEEVVETPPAEETTVPAETPNVETPPEETPYVPDLVGEPQKDEVIILERELPHDKVITIELHVEFDLNKATVKPEYSDQIKKVADFMKKYPETEALLVGHTCSLGSEEYNLKLSERRANAVRNYLVNKFGIAPSRLKTHGAGESEPIADNNTEAGREKNRRVMAVISTIVKDVIIIEQEVLKSDFLRDDFVLPPIEPKEDVIPEATTPPDKGTATAEPADTAVAPGQPTSNNEITDDTGISENVPTSSTESASEDEGITTTEDKDETGAVIAEPEETTAITAPIQEATPPETVTNQQESPSTPEAELPAQEEATEITEEPVVNTPPAATTEISADNQQTPSPTPVIGEKTGQTDTGEMINQEEKTLPPVDKGTESSSVAEPGASATTSADTSKLSPVQEEPTPVKATDTPEDVIAEPTNANQSPSPAVAEEQGESADQAVSSDEDQAAQKEEIPPAAKTSPSPQKSAVVPPEATPDSSATSGEDNQGSDITANEEEKIDKDFAYEPSAQPVAATSATGNNPVEVEAAEPVFPPTAPTEDKPPLPNWK